MSHTPPQADPGRKTRTILVCCLVALIIGALGAAGIVNLVQSAVSSLPKQVPAITVQTVIQPTETVTLAPTPSRRGVEQAKTAVTPQSQPPAPQATPTSLPQTTTGATPEETATASTSPSKTPSTTPVVKSTEPSAPATTAAAEATQ